MQFFLINNPVISSCKWVVLAPDRPEMPHLTAELRIFESDQAAREDSATFDGVLVPGRQWVLRFSGVVNSSRFPITLTYDIEIPQFLEQAALWCASLPLAW